MARARNIKPGFFMNEDLAEIDTMGRLLFIGLWTIADRDGRLEDRPKRIKGQLFPYDNCDTDALLNDLQEWGFIRRYDGQRVTGEPVKIIQVINFSKHQNPHINEKKSELLPYNAPTPTPEIKKENVQLKLNFEQPTEKNISISEKSDVDNFVDNFIVEPESVVDENVSLLADIPPKPQEIKVSESTIQAPYKHNSNPAESSTLITESNKVEMVEDDARAHTRDIVGNSEYEEVLNAFSLNVHPILNDIEKKKLVEILDTYGAKWCMAAIETTGLNNGKTIMYTLAVLKRWQKEGFQSDNRKKKTNTQQTVKNSLINTNQFQNAPSSQLEKGLIAIQKLRAERNMQVMAV